MLGPREIKVLLQSIQKKPELTYGQNFLISETVLGKIMTAALMAPAPTQVLEIGPGLGVLTGPLCDTLRDKKEARLVAVEADRVLAETLPSLIGSPRCLKVVPTDIVQFDPGAWWKEGEYDLVSNLPFQVSNFVLHRFLTQAPRPRRAILMLQKEVVDKLLAPTGSRERGPLTIMVEYYTASRVVATVPAGAFWPAPQVEAKVIELVFTTPLAESDAALWKLVKAGFANRRKTLVNSLGMWLPEGGKAAAAQWLAAAGLPPTARAEELSLEQWLALHSSR